MKKIFVICPTYRCTSDIISSYFRMFGVVSLVQQMHNQTGNYDIKLCIVDSSADIHPFFKKYDCNSINTENICIFIYQIEIAFLIVYCINIKHLLKTSFHQTVIFLNIHGKQ